MIASYFFKSSQLPFNIKKVFNTIIDIANNEFNINVIASFCDIQNALPLKEQYLLNTQALALSFYEGNNMLIPCSSLLKYIDTPDLKELLSKATYFVNNLKINDLRELLKNFYEQKPVFSYMQEIKDFYKALITLLIETCGIYEITEAIQILSDMNITDASHKELYEAIIAATELFHDNLSYSDAAISQIEDYIKKNYSKNITLQSLAKEFLFDYTNLSRRFQKKTKMTFSKFLNTVRLDEALKLILTTDFKCSQIATMVGYNNYENFSRSFKNKFGKWPNDYRKAKDHD